MLSSGWAAPTSSHSPRHLIQCHGPPLSSTLLSCSPAIHGYFLPPQSWNPLAVQSPQSLAIPDHLSRTAPESSFASWTGSHSIANTPSPFTLCFFPSCLPLPQIALTHLSKPTTYFRDSSSLSPAMKPSNHRTFYEYHPLLNWNIEAQRRLPAQSSPSCSAANYWAFEVHGCCFKLLHLGMVSLQTLMDKHSSRACLSTTPSPQGNQPLF